MIDGVTGFRKIGPVDVLWVLWSFKFIRPITVKLCLSMWFLAASVLFSVFAMSSVYIDEDNIRAPLAFFSVMGVLLFGYFMFCNFKDVYKYVHFVSRCCVADIRVSTAREVTLNINGEIAGEVIMDITDVNGNVFNNVSIKLFPLDIVSVPMEYRKALLLRNGSEDVVVFVR